MAAISATYTLCYNYIDMPFFRRSAQSSESSSIKEKEVGPITTEIFTSPPEGTVPTKKWNYDEHQLAQVSLAATAELIIRSRSSRR